MTKLRATLLGATALLAGSLGLSAAASAQETLTFTSFGGSYQEAQRAALLDPITEATGVEFREDTLTGIAEVRAQVRSGAVNWDIVDLGLPDCAAGEAEGLFEPIDYSIVSTEGFDEAAYSESWIGTIYFATVMGYSTETYADKQPESWADFWDVETFPGTRSMRNSPLANLEIALIADGVAPEDVYPIDFERAFAKLDEIKPHVTVWWTSGAQSAQLISDGEVDMITAWNGRLDTAMNNGAAVDYTFNNAIASLDCLAIPKGAPNKDKAMEMLALMVSPEYAANIPEFINYGPTTSLAFDTGKITDEMRAISPSAPENLETQVITDADFWREHRQEAQELWDSWITR